jgi:hypothetical protein
MKPFKAFAAPEGASAGTAIKALGPIFNLNIVHGGVTASQQRTNDLQLLGKQTHILF